MTIAVTDLRHEYAGRTVLELASWQVERGQRCIVIGRSGSGKTTLLHSLAGILKPTRGRIDVDGTRIDALNGAALDRFRGRHIGIVLQRLHLIRALSVRENLSLAQHLAGLPPDDARIDAVTQALGIAEKLDAKPHQLSYGQQQRVAIARAVLNRPALILADEPTSNLDDENCQEALKVLLAQAHSVNASLIVATHDSRIRAQFERQLVLEDGRALA